MQQFFKSFDIVLDIEEKKKQVSYFKKLINSVSSKLRASSSRRPSKTATSNILKMYNALKSEEVKHTNCFRIRDNEFEFDILGYERARNTRSNSNKYNLMRDFERLVKLLSSYIDEPKEKEYEIEVTIEIPRRKKLKKVTTFEKITILERWVKIGYKMYRRNFDIYSGDSYIVVDGDVYTIECDRYGREKLA